jgi:hypothetical protein
MHKCKEQALLKKVALSHNHLPFLKHSRVAVTKPLTWESLSESHFPYSLHATIHTWVKFPYKKRCLLPVLHMVY